MYTSSLTRNNYVLFHCKPHVRSLRSLLDCGPKFGRLDNPWGTVWPTAGTTRSMYHGTCPGQALLKGESEAAIWFVVAHALTSPIDCSSQAMEY
jgi:hypothetical protein